jgi:hypothetical protein
MFCVLVPVFLHWRRLRGKLKQFGRRVWECAGRATPSRHRIHPNRIHISPPLSTAASTIDIIPGLHCPSQYVILLPPSDKVLTRAYNRF